MKIALIGGGSVRTVYFIQSLVKFAERLGIDHVSIMDTDPLKLEIFGSLAEYIVSQAGSTLKITVTLNLDEAVTAADYVVTTLRVGQDNMRCRDERIALSKGLIGQETTGAAGFSYAIRTIPAILNICETIRQKSNNAIVFNFTNPSGLITQAIYDAGYQNVIGICDNATGIKINLAKSLQLNASDFFVKVYGLNHLSWADEVSINGVNILPKLLESEYFVNNFYEFSYFDPSLIKQIKSIPNGYLYYYYHRERALKNMLSSEKTRGETIRDINSEMLNALKAVDVHKNPEQAMQLYRFYMQQREGSYMQMELGSKSTHSEQFDTGRLNIPEIINRDKKTEVYEGYAGVAFNYIESIQNNVPIDLAVTVPNNGAMRGLADSDVVETTCVVDGAGAHPVKTDNIPEDNMLLIQQIKRFEKLTIDAVRNQSAELACEALMVHPLVNSYSLAKELTMDYLKLNEPFIGQWK